MLLMTAATETITNRASTPGSGVFCGSIMESELPTVVSGVPAWITVGLTWIGGKAELALSGVGATRDAVVVVVDKRTPEPPTAALSWLLVEPRTPVAVVTSCVL